MIVLINPNSTAAMTDAMLRAARDAAPMARFEGWTSHDGPAAIEGAADGDAAIPPLLDLVRDASDRGARAIIIGCFDDTGLEQARTIAACPVIGIGQAGCCLAALAGGRFSVVTTLAVSIPVIEDNIRRYGLDRHLGRVRASDVPVLALEGDADSATAKVVEAIRDAEREDDIGAIVLGCGGMVDIAACAGPQTKTRLIDGVRAAALMASAL
ncbi:MAG: aspartate/glutamate racemase family protein [Rhodobacteraceae bacterium]|nr:aspartate/glutamate racemase family protein [Paracoccaceae bacterium]